MFHVGAKEKETWEELQHCFQFTPFCLVLVNDNFHSYNEVTRVLSTTIDGLSNKACQDLTELVDKGGRAILKVGSYKECAIIGDRIYQSSRRDGHRLKTAVLPSYVVAHQEFAIRLLQWLPTLFDRCSGFRALFAEIAFSVKIIKNNSAFFERFSQSHSFFSEGHHSSD
jgi:E3 ubiquitin-protein ligase UBR2